MPPLFLRLVAGDSAAHLPAAGFAAGGRVRV